MMLFNFVKILSHSLYLFIHIFHLFHSLLTFFTDSIHQIYPIIILSSPRIIIVYYLCHILHSLNSILALDSYHSTPQSKQLIDIFIY
jgi:hypothetical protein